MRSGLPGRCGVQDGHEWPAYSYQVGLSNLAFSGVLLVGLSGVGVIWLARLLKSRRLGKAWYVLRYQIDCLCQLQAGLSSGLSGMFSCIESISLSRARCLHQLQMIQIGNNSLNIFCADKRASNLVLQKHMSGMLARSSYRA